MGNKTLQRLAACGNDSDSDSSDSSAEGGAVDTARTGALYKHTQRSAQKERGRAGLYLGYFVKASSKSSSSSRYGPVLAR